MYEIGKLMAAAAAREAERLARFTLDLSPIPAGTRYDPPEDVDWLVAVEERPADLTLRAVSADFAAASAKERSRQRNAIGMKELYLLLRFARRSAVFAIRRKHAGHIAEGLRAVAMIDLTRIDPRDASPPLALLAHAAQVLGVDPVPSFLAAAAIAEPAVAGLLSGFPARSETLLRDWGFAATGTGPTAGFVDSGGDAYDPSAALDLVAIALDRVFAADAYLPGRVTVATALPPYWLGGVDDDALAQATTSVRACVSVSASDRASTREGTFGDQSLLCFVLEMRHSEDAETMARIARRRSLCGDDVAVFGTCVGRLFCVAIGRSFVANVPSVESSATIRRFEPAIEAVLRSYPNG